jgi:hypothetical protein
VKDERQLDALPSTEKFRGVFGVTFRPWSPQCASLSYHGLETELRSIMPGAELETA